MNSRDKELSFKEFKEEVLKDYRLAVLSRRLSIAGRKEVLNGKAKFGIFGDGKEVAQIALAKTFKNGDWRSGYYRDQTFMLATELLTPEEFFYQLYGETNVDRNKSTGGRAMNNHFGTKAVDENGDLLDIDKKKNSSSDISCTAGQMPRLLGLAYASKIIRNSDSESLKHAVKGTGNEVAFGTIGDASTSEGHFWEVINAAGVLQVPLALSVWDDGYGISVPRSLQTTKDSISEVLKGFQKRPDTNGLHIFKVKGWDYASLCKTFTEGIAICREKHEPVVFHVEELTQPLGHSSSGSHERYKSEKQLTWEKEHDCNVKLREWILTNNIADESELKLIETDVDVEVRDAKKKAYKTYRKKFDDYIAELENLYTTRTCNCKAGNIQKLDECLVELKQMRAPFKTEIMGVAKKMIRYTCSSCTGLSPFRNKLEQWLTEKRDENRYNYSRHLYFDGDEARMENVSPVYDETSKEVNGSEVIRANFDALFEKDPRIVAFGEDSGKLGDVNQGMTGLQEKYGELRISDTGIRETSIAGQGIGLAIRGFRPIAEVQYLDYLLYTLQTLSDDLATLSWRTVGQQVAPLIVRTRGHRLEGIWHAGSPMGMLLHSLRGMYICVPRNMTQAAGMYNQLMKLNSPAVLIEPLNGYRRKEKLPKNPGEYTVALGQPEILNVGKDVTVVTYGSCVKIAKDGLAELEKYGISVELIDVQTLLPFDVNRVILESIKKTSRVIFFDEDVPGGGTGYMMQQVLEKQGAFRYLDSAPVTLSGHDHRPAYHSDGDYFSNPNGEDFFERVYAMMHEFNPNKYPKVF